VFDTGDGAHIHDPRYLGRRFEPLTDRLGLPRIKFHGLRHTAATNMLKRGVPVHVVAQMLGHNDPGITLRVYAHVLADMQQDAAARIDAMFGT
jgi:integrase